MFGTLGILFSLIPVVVIVAIIYGISHMRKRSAPSEEGIGTAKRLYLYLVAIAGLMAGTSGVLQIARFVLDALPGTDGVSSSSTGLAVGLALTIVGLPLWFVHWRMIGNSVREHESEKGTLLRKLYVYVTLGVAIGLMAHAVVEILQWIFRAEVDFRGYPWAALVIWGGVWLYHWRFEQLEGQPSEDSRAVRSLYVYIVAGAALVLLATGLARIVHLILLSGYESLASIPVFAPGDGGLWRGAIRKGIILTMVGGAGWYFHWLRFAADDTKSMLRRLFVNLFASYGALITVLVALGIIIARSLLWGFGGGNESAALYFRFFPATIASLAAGIAVGVYHHNVATKESGEAPQDWAGVREWNPYLLTATGLVALVIGVVTAVSTVVGVLAHAGTDILVGSTAWQGGVALAITLTLIGGPLWWKYWAKAQVRAVDGTQAKQEEGWSARRTTLPAILAVGLLALLGALSHVLFVFLRDLLDSGLGRSTVLDFQISIGILAAVAAFLPYYLSVYRAEQADGAVLPIKRKKKNVSVLAPADSGDVLKRLEETLGYSVEHMRSTDERMNAIPLSDAALEALVGQIGDASGDKVLVVFDGQTAKIYPYR